MVGHHGGAVIDALDHGARQDRQQQRLVALLGEPDLRHHRALAITQKLVLERGADARAQQRRRERLRQIIDCARLDAANDRVHLVERRNHDHRDFGGVADRASACSGPRSRSFPASSRRAGSGRRQRSATSASASMPDAALVDRMAVAGKLPRQQIAVRGIVVDHEDLAGDRLLRSRGLRAAQRVEHARGVGEGRLAAIVACRRPKMRPARRCAPACRRRRRAAFRDPGSSESWPPSRASSTIISP